MSELNHGARFRPGARELFPDRRSWAGSGHAHLEAEASESHTPAWPPGARIRGGPAHGRRVGGTPRTRLSVETLVHPLQVRTPFFRVTWPPGPIPLIEVATMKAISLWQPWASAMGAGWKHNETRSWYTSYRGPLLIHSAKKPTHWPSIDVQALFHPMAFQPIDLPRGCLICLVQLIDCRKILLHNRPPEGTTERMLGDYTPGRFMWITENLSTFTTPIPWKGSQGFFEVPDDVVELGLELSE